LSMRSSSLVVARIRRLSGMTIRPHLAVELLRASGGALAPAIIGRQAHAPLSGASFLGIGQCDGLGGCKRIRQGCVNVFAFAAHHCALAFVASFFTAAQRASISVRASLAWRESGCSGPVRPLLSAET